MDDRWTIMTIATREDNPLMVIQPTALPESPEEAMKDTYRLAAAAADNPKTCFNKS